MEKSHQNTRKTELEVVRAVRFKFGRRFNRRLETSFEDGRWLVRFYWRDLLEETYIVVDSEISTFDFKRFGDKL